MAAAQAPSSPTDELMHFGFTARMFEGINLNDARAAMRVWTQEVAATRGLPVSPEIVSFDRVDDVVKALNESRLEAITLTAGEYWELRDRVSVGPLLLSRTNGEAFDHYVLLVRKADQISSLTQLRGKKLVMLLSARSCIMPEWLDLELYDADLPAPADHFGDVRQEAKLSRNVLNVFFGQSDACIVTRQGFELMQELNPQVGKQLEVLLESPPVVSSFFFFRGNFVSPSRQLIIDEFTSTNENPGKSQILTLFQQEELFQGTPEDLAETLALLDRHAAIDRPRSTP